MAVLEQFVTRWTNMVSASCLSWPTRLNMLRVFMGLFAKQLAPRRNLALAAYNVSGEFAMIKAAAQNGWIDERRVTMEVLTGIRRAGADMIITYFAPDVATWLKE